MKWTAIAVLLMVAFLTSGDAGGQRASDREMRVLFIGNSLTYYNDLPQIVEALAAQSGNKIAVKMIAEPNFALEDHWKKGDALKLIQRERWDFIVLQQGPSASTEGRDLLLEYARVFASEIKKHRAKPAFYSVWPTANRPQDFVRAAESYRMAATGSAGIFIPVADAWAAASKLDPTIKLYAEDGLHPAQAGSYLAAVVINRQLFNTSPQGLPHKLKLRSGKNIEITEKEARLIQNAVASALASK